MHFPRHIKIPLEFVVKFWPHPSYHEVKINSNICFRDLNLQNINRVHGQLTAIKGGNEVYSARLWGLQPSLPLSTFISQNVTRRERGRKETQEGMERLKSRGVSSFHSMQGLLCLIRVSFSKPSLLPAIQCLCISWCWKKNKVCSKTHRW